MDFDVELEELNMTDLEPEFDRGSADVITFLRAVSAAGMYSESTTYAAGEYVTYGGELYVCAEDGATGEWDEAKWQKADIIQMIQDHAASTDHVQEIIDTYGGE